MVLWPLLALPVGVYPKGYFKFWVYVSILWALISTATSVVLTDIEARSLITEVLYDGDKLGNNSSVVGGAGGPVNRLGLVAVTRGSSVNRLGLMASASSGSVNRLGLSSTEGNRYKSSCLNLEHSNNKHFLDHSYTGSRHSILNKSSHAGKYISPDSPFRVTLGLSSSGKGLSSSGKATVVVPVTSRGF